MNTNLSFSLRCLRALLAAGLATLLVACSGGTTVPEVQLPAGQPIALKNPSFNADAQGRFADWASVEHNVGNSYSFVADAEDAHSAPSSARIRRHGPEIFGLLEQTMRVQPAWFGKTVRLSGYLKTAGASGGGGSLVLQARDSGGLALVHDHMDNRKVKGDQGWKLYTAQVKVPTGAWAIQVGVMLEDGGTLWADDLVLELMD